MGATSNSVVYYTVVKVQIPENISNNFLPSMTARATIFGEDIKKYIGRTPYCSTVQISKGNMYMLLKTVNQYVQLFLQA